jgi:predicted small integral membrane protein
MFYVVAILIAGLWAAFLLPSFFDHRSRAPKTTTRDFARTRRLLEQVTTADADGEAYVRHHAQVRRQRILIALVITAFVSLAIATWMGSIAWLWLTLAIDVAVAVYVTGLLYVKQQRSLPRATVVPIGAVRQPVAPAVVEDPPAYAETPTVRVIAG